MFPRTTLAALSSALLIVAALSTGAAAPSGPQSPISSSAPQAPLAASKPPGHTASSISAAGSVVRIEGRGFGHGRGMSQWGARGAAEAPYSLPWRSIVAFYYPGTAVGAVANSAIRIQLSAWGSGATTVLAAPGLTLDTGTCAQVLPTSSAIPQWRARRGTGLWRVEYFSTSAGSIWRPFTSTCAYASAGSVTFRTTAQARTSAVALVHPGGSARTYRGWARAVRSGSSQATVNVVTLEHYLWGVLPSEMPAGWPAEALSAQAVAARSYAARRIGGSGAWDLCDTTSCQVYSGTSVEHPSATAAVGRTAGAVLRYGGAIAFTEFSAYNGGWIAPGSVPYQVGKADPYDGANATPAASWYVSLGYATLESAYPSIGRFVGISVARDGQGRWGGRATSVIIRGTAASSTVSGGSFRSRFGLRSTYVNPTILGGRAGSDFDGDGHTDVLARQTSTGALWLYPGNGAGSWLRRAQVGSGWSAFSELTDIGAFNGDGTPDLLARQTATGALWLYPGNGRGGWLRPVQVGAGWGDFSELTGSGDWGGDGFVDLLARRTSTGALWLYPGNGRGGWLRPVQVGAGWGDFSELTGPGDWGGDGFVDLLARRTSTGALWLYRGSGQGGWRSPVQVGTGWSTYSRLTS